MDNKHGNIVLNLKQAAEACGVSPHIMGTLINRNDFPAFRVGKRWLIPRDSLEIWLRTQAAKRSVIETVEV